MIESTPSFSVMLSGAKRNRNISQKHTGDPSTTLRVTSHVIILSAYVPYPQHTVLAIRLLLYIVLQMLIFHYTIRTNEVLLISSRYFHAIM